MGGLRWGGVWKSTLVQFFNFFYHCHHRYYTVYSIHANALFLTPKKETKLLELRGRGGNARKKALFFTNVFPYLCFPDCKTIENWRLVNNLTQEVITDATIECKSESGGEWSISSTFLVWESFVSTLRCILRWNWVQEHQGVPGCLRNAGLCNLHGRGGNKLWRHLNCILRSVLIFPHFSYWLEPNR